MPNTPIVVWVGCTVLGASLSFLIHPHNSTLKRLVIPMSQTRSLLLILSKEILSFIQPRLSGFLRAQGLG
jgi:hypothetical protein